MSSATTREVENNRPSRVFYFEISRNYEVVENNEKGFECSLKTVVKALECPGDVNLPRKNHVSSVFRFLNC